MQGNGRETFHTQMRSKQETRREFIFRPLIPAKPMARAALRRLPHRCGSRKFAAADRFCRELE
eukprot:scaffold578_cov243-Pinguiococcus_pyrenoidosus.AAC.3